ncbi:uncharacterized protein LOC142175511 [Nicotiana tabacum]|uniref:Uncharacterized protein LOC142175511 n=1 Tax=Nicotiana tabacum TaxID=4097 RepID=A0AC58TMS8_TOBAC
MAFCVQNSDTDIEIDELHLEGQQFVSFKSNADIHTIVNNPMIQKTMLTEFFSMNETNEDAKELNLLYKEFREYFVWSSTDKFWARRQNRCVVGRIVTCHPTEGERYYLRLLLIHVRGPISYKDLLTVNEKPCSTFRESVEKRGLLHCDNCLIECMSEAASYQMPYSLRRLFATLLVYCGPVNPRKLWEQFEESMIEDYKVLQITERREIQYQALNHINDILYFMGHDINEYVLIPETIRPSAAAKEIHFERSIIVSEDDVLLHRKLNKNQLIAYNLITERIFSNKAGAFFVDGPGGTRKTFLYRALLATVRSMRYIALATDTSGVAASILPGGRTAHSHFKIPIDIDENTSCNISKENSLAGLIRDAKLIVWDEVSKAKKRMLEVFDLLLKNIMNTNALFGGKVVVLGGDFRQTLPVVQYGKKEDFIGESLLYSSIWNKLEKLKLSENMRAKTDPVFCDYLLRIGNGQERVNSVDKIEISDSLIIPYTTERESVDKLFATTYSNLNSTYSNSSCTDSCVILTTKNDFVDEINDMLIDRFRGKSKIFIGTYEAIEFNNQTQLEDLLHTLCFAMTINKAQGQTLDFVGIYLREPHFHTCITSLARAFIYCHGKHIMHKDIKSLNLLVAVQINFMYYRDNDLHLIDVQLQTFVNIAALEFICKNRETLESEYVIDLATIVFYYLTYQGDVDVDTMDDVAKDPFLVLMSVLPRKKGSPLAENIELAAQCFGTLSTSEIF